jgi:hypothetical protein
MDARRNLMLEAFLQGSDLDGDFRADLDGVLDSDLDGDLDGTQRSRSPIHLQRG